MASSIIGLSGKKRTGKDTIGRRLVDEHGFTRVSFPDPLKAAALAIDPIVDVFDADTSCGDPAPGGGSDPDLTTTSLSKVVGALGWERAKDEYPEVRRILHTTGRAFRAIDPLVWVKAGLATADTIDGPVVRVIRDTDDADTDESETALDDHEFDWNIGNNRDIDSLYQLVDVLAALLG